MAEDLVKAITTQATSILLQHVRDQLNQVVNVEDDIHELITTLNSIHAEVRDAEKREIERDSIRNWVRNLKSTSYDIDDALTDWAIAIHEVNGNTSRSNLRKKVCLAIVFPCVSSKPVSSLIKVANRIKHINKRLVSINTQKNAFNFASTPSNPNDQETVLIDPQSENETTSFADPSTIFGRDDEKSKLLSKLTNEGNPLIVFIWGMGGIGKSTLSRLIFDSVEIQQDFEIKMWVSVGRIFDTTRIAKAIFEQSVKDVSQDFSEFQTALTHVRDSVNGKKFLLVLDNVWEEDHSVWEPLLVALNGGKQGSKILITSRNEGIGKKIKAIMDETELYNLGALSDEHILTVFSRFAFSGRNHEFYEDRKVIGRQISDKCKGLPLAAKTVGSLMMLKDTKQEWEHVLDDKIWQFELNQSLSRPLLFSYYDLPPAIKRCFCYCANFAKDSKIDAVNLVQIWMSQGYLGSDENIEMEIIGRGYLNSLLTRSLFQDPERDKDNGTLLRFKMHDMVHDVANYLMENECSMVIVDQNPEEDQRPWMNFRHLTIIREDNTTFPVPPNDPQRLYTFSVQSFHDCPPIVTQDCLQLPPKFFDRFKYLKTLDLSRNKLLSLPDDVEKLKNLRYLNLSHNPLYKLPETVCSLPNLQTLKLFACRHLTELPKSIYKLKKLRHLEIDQTSSLVTLPKGVAKLTSLRTLSRFLIGTEDASCSLADLKHLNLLQGHLKIEDLNRADVSEAKEAELEKKEHLVDLYINCSSASAVIDSFQLNTKLVALQIDRYGGQRFPTWMACLTNLKKLRLQKWGSCVCLPPLGKLPSLKILIIEGFSDVTYVGSEFLGVETEETDIQKTGEIGKASSASSTTAFRKLEKLKFSHLEKWKEWNVRNNIEIMPCLRYLKVSHCKTLQSIPPEVLRLPLKKLRVRSCVILKQRYQKETGEDREMVSHISNVRIH